MEDQVHNDLLLELLLGEAELNRRPRTKLEPNLASVGARSPAYAWATGQLVEVILPRCRAGLIQSPCTVRS